MKFKEKRKNKNSAEEYVLAYSTDPEPPKRCSSCLQYSETCTCKKEAETIPLTTLKPSIRIEKKGRGGKAVTVIYKLPPQKEFLKKLCDHLKKSLGTGGTFLIEDGEGLIEIQGERPRDQIMKLITEYHSQS